MDFCGGYFQQASITDTDGANLFSVAVAAHEADALGGVDDIVVPVILVLDGDVALEMLSIEFVEDAGHVGNSGTIGNIMRVGGHFIHVVEVDTDDPTLQNLQAVNGL
jgi:hypothetical protein